MSRATLTRLKSWRKWLFSSPPSEAYYKGGVRLASSADAALVIIALAAMLLRSSILTVHLCQGLV